MGRDLPETWPVTDPVMVRPIDPADDERDWVVERTWLVKARTARDALEATMGGKLLPEQIRVYEGPPRPWGDE